MDDNNKVETSGVKDFLSGVLIGGVIGTIAALVFAPKSGKELRKDIETNVFLALDKTDQLKDSVMQRGIEIRDIANEARIKLTKNIQDQTQDLVEKVQSLTKETEEDAQEVLEDAKKTIEELSNEINQKLDHLKND